MFSLEDYRVQSQNFQSKTPSARFGINLGPISHLFYYAFRRFWTKVLSGRLRDEADSSNPLLFVAKKFEDVHVRNGRLYANRYDMIGSLPKNLVWAEIGTWEGAFAAEIQRLCEPGELHLFDISFDRMKQKGHIAEGDSVVLHEGPSSQQMSLLPDSKFDVIYIDGDHSQRGVAADAEIALRKVKPDGLLIFNDYIRFDYVEMYPFGTVPVVNSLCVDHGFEILGFAFHNKMYCDIMLRRRAS